MVPPGRVTPVTLLPRPARSMTTSLSVPILSSSSCQISFTVAVLPLTLAEIFTVSRLPVTGTVMVLLPPPEETV